MDSRKEKTMDLHYRQPWHLIHSVLCYGWLFSCVSALDLGTPENKDCMFVITVSPGESRTIVWIQGMLNKCLLT